MAQTVYNDFYGVGEAGQIADVSLRQVDSFFNESGDIPFGIGLIQGTAYNQAKVPSSFTDKIIGIAVKTDVYDNLSLSGSNGVPSGGPVNILSFGDIYVLPEQSVSPGDPVYMRIVAPGSEQVGAFRKDSDSGNAILVPGLSWFTTGSATSPAMLRVRLGFVSSSTGDQVLIRVEHGEVTADTTIPMVIQVPAGKVFVLDSAYVNNETGLAEDLTNFFTFQVLNGATVLASRNTKTGEGGSLPASTPTLLTNGSLANRTVVGMAEITILLDEDGTATLPAGSFVLVGRMI